MKRQDRLKTGHCRGVATAHVISGGRVWMSRSGEGSGEEKDGALLVSDPRCPAERRVSLDSVWGASPKPDVLL